MIRTLITIRFKSMLAAMTAQAHKRNKSGKGTIVLYVILYLYIIAVMAGMMGVNFYSLSTVYHQMGLDWLYFSLAGLMGLGFSLIGSVFTTQSQLYDAKDNQLLLAMPIPPETVLLSRMIPLLLMNLLFTAVVMVPAIIVYAAFIDLSVTGILFQLVNMLAVTLLAQALACILGWFLHLMLSKIHKSVASIVYLVLFLCVYFLAVSHAQDILNAMITNSELIAHTFSSWVWPLYAMGAGCAGSIAHSIVLPLISAAVFAIVYRFLSATFIKSASRTNLSSKKRKLNLTQAKQTSPIEAVIRKELKKFLGTPIYLTNNGMGILMMLVALVAGIVMRGQIMDTLSLLPELGEMIPLLICSVCSFMISTMCISTPSVSLEGKNIWILKSLPISEKDILLAKLGLHNRLTIPVSCAAGGILAAVYGCDLPGILLCATVPGLLALLSGLVGMVAGLRWARLDYISEAYPCKQSVSVAVTMFGIMGLPLVLGLLYFLVFYSALSPTAFLGLCALILCALCWSFYKLLITWGIKRWNML